MEPTEPTKKKKKGNLIPFKPGKDKRRNLKGRPKKLPEIDKLLIDVLGEKNEDGITKVEQILLKVAAKALSGNLMAADMLLNRAYGKTKLFETENESGRDAFLEAMKAASLRRERPSGTNPEDNLTERIILTQQISVTSENAQIEAINTNSEETSSLPQVKSSNQEQEILDRQALRLEEKYQKSLERKRQRRDDNLSNIFF